MPSQWTQISSFFVESSLLCNECAFRLISKQFLNTVVCRLVGVVSKPVRQSTAEHCHAETWLYFPRRWTFVIRLRPISSSALPRICRIAPANVLHAPTCFVIHKSPRSLSYRCVLRRRFIELAKNVLNTRQFLVDLRVMSANAKLKFYRSVWFEYSL